MSNLDVLIIGGYSLTDISSGGIESRRKTMLFYKNMPATLQFIKLLVKNKGDLSVIETNMKIANKEKFINRPLNVIYLYDYLLRNDIKAEVINYFLLEPDRFKQIIAQKPRVVAISTTFICDVSEINVIAKEIKKHSPNSIIIAGGIKILKSHKKHLLFHQNYFDGFESGSIVNNNYFFKHEIDKHIDIFVIEECGELTLLDLIKRILKNENYKNTPNIAYYKNKELVFNDKVKEPYAFENNIISWNKISTDIIGNEIPVRAGIGCPFKCAFCDFTGLHKVKIRSIDNLIEELKLIQEAFPGKRIFFTDDNLFTTKKRTKDLAEAIVTNNLKFKWRAFFRVDAISEENVEILAKSGCIMCFLGVESGDENILENMNKKATRKQILNAIYLLNKSGINTLSTIIIGFPGETKQSVDNTISLLNSYPDQKETINQYYPFTFIPMPLAPISSPENRKKYAITGGTENWSHSTMNSKEAKEHLLYLFKKVESPTLLYPEFLEFDLPVYKLKEFFKTRDNVVKNGINSINKDNVNQIYKSFETILSQ